MERNLFEFISSLYPVVCWSWLESALDNHLCTLLPSSKLMLVTSSCTVIGSLKLARVEVFVPWKSAKATN